MYIWNLQPIDLMCNLEGVLNGNKDFGTVTTFQVSWKFESSTLKFALAFQGQSRFRIKSNGPILNWTQVFRFISKCVVNVQWPMVVLVNCFF